MGRSQSKVQENLLLRFDSVRNIWGGASIIRGHIGDEGKICYWEGYRVTAVTAGSRFLMTGPTIRKVSSFCNGLGNVSKGILSPGQRRRNKVRKSRKERIYRPDPVILGKLSATVPKNL